MRAGPHTRASTSDRLASAAGKRRRPEALLEFVSTSDQYSVIHGIEDWTFAQRSAARAFFRELAQRLFPRLQRLNFLLNIGDFGFGAFAHFLCARTSVFAK